jgi:CheY-like chemotaxis protein
VGLELKSDWRITPDLQKFSENTKTVLLVEDEALIAMRQAAILTRNGFNVLKAYHARKALEIVAARDVDLILMDIDLGRGKMDGTEAAEIIAGEYDIPIIFLTSHSEKEYVEKIRKITGYGYVLKNAGEFVLIQSIQMAFELFKAYRELSAIYENTPVLMLLVDKDRKIRKANAFLHDFAGSSAEQAMGKRVGEVLRCINSLDNPWGCGFSAACKDCTIRNSVLDTLRAGKKYTKIEASIPYRENAEARQLTTLLSTALLRQGNENLCLVTIEDITEQKSIQNDLKKEERQKQFLMQELNHRVKTTF